jgi:hypothetical protein
MEYRILSKDQLLSHVSNSPPDTPVWINSMMELQRRREEYLVHWTQILVIVSIVLAASTIVDVAITFVFH